MQKIPFDRQLLSFATLLSLLLAGCGSSGGSNQKGAGPAQSQTLEGHWRLECQTIGDKSTMVDSHFKGNTLSFKSVLYTDKNCQNVDMVSEGSGTFTIPPSGNGFFSETAPFNNKFDHVFFTIMSPSSIRVFNEAKLCSVDNWKVGEAVECKDESYHAENFTIIKLQANKLYFGKDSGELDGSSEAKRHKDFIDVPYSRIQ